MAKFIEVHEFRTKEKLCVNTDRVESFGDPIREGHATLYLTGYKPEDGGYIEVKETYEQVRLMIGALQGGIPMAIHTDHIKDLD